MTIQLFEPVCDVETLPQQAVRKLGGLKGRKVGYIFNQHISAATFWKTLEDAVEKQFSPSAVHRLYKTNTWASAPKPEVDELLRQSDYTLIGVGA
jgi:hypothetical protein